MIPFDQTSYLSQIRKLRELALDVIKKYSLKNPTIEFIKYGANATFKVTDSHHKKYVLRIRPADYHTQEALLEEYQWLEFIAKTNDLIVPKILLNRDAKFYIEGFHPQIPGGHICDMFAWIDGKFKWKGINKNYAYHLGELMGQLHKIGKSIKIKHRNYWDTEGLVGTHKPRFWNLDKLTDISIKQQEIITAARKYAYQQLKQYEKKHPHKLGLIHGDLNPNNILVRKDHYAVIDFDDCGVGFYDFDIAGVLFAFEYLTEGVHKKSFTELKEALFQGYSKHMSLTQEDIDMLPYFLLAQKLCAVGSIELRKNNPKMRHYYLESVKRAIQYFLSIEGTSK